MAERRAGDGGVWRFVAVALLALLGLLLWGATRPAPPDGPRVAPAAAPEAAGALALSEEELGRPDRLAALVGRAVRLDGTRVRAVVGDEAFWVGPSAERRLFVVFDEAGIGDEAVDVDAGQTVNLAGELRSLPEPAEAGRRWGLAPADADALAGERVYLYTRLVTIVSGG